RASAHAGHNAGVFGFLAGETDQDHVTLGADEVAQDTQHLHSHGLRLGALEDGVSYALHAGTDFVHGHDLRRSSYFGLGRRVACTGEGRDLLQAHKDEESEREYSFFHTANGRVPLAAAHAKLLATAKKLAAGLGSFEHLYYCRTSHKAG